jgi:hypothetical protein
MKKPILLLSMMVASVPAFAQEEVGKIVEIYPQQTTCVVERIPCGGYCYGDTTRFERAKFTVDVRIADVGPFVGFAGSCANMPGGGHHFPVIGRVIRLEDRLLPGNVIQRTVDLNIGAITLSASKRR